MPMQAVSATFKTEHSLMRQTLATLTAVQRAGEWRQAGPALGRLAELLEFQELFDEVCHRPKCEALWQAVGQRRARGAQHRGRTVHHCKLRARLTLQTLGLLCAVQRQEPGADAALAGQLEPLQARVLTGLEWEDAVLLPHARDSLQEQDWERLRQAFDAMPYPAAALYQPDRAAATVRRRPESPARFEHSGFVQDVPLDFSHVPRFRPPQRS